MIYFNVLVSKTFSSILIVKSWSILTGKYDGWILPKYLPDWTICVCEAIRAGQLPTLSSKLFESSQDFLKKFLSDPNFDRPVQNCTWKYIFWERKIPVCEDMDEALETEDVSGDQICGKLPPSGLSSASVSVVMYKCIISYCISCNVEVYHHVLDIFSIAWDIFCVITLRWGSITLFCIVFYDVSCKIMSKFKGRYNLQEGKYSKETGDTYLLVKRLHI